MCPPSALTASQRGVSLALPRLFHHARHLEHVCYGQVRQVRLADETLAPCHGADCDWFDDWRHALYMETCYRWLADRVGFWPLFLGVGCHAWDLQLTGYQNQWRRILSQSRDETIYRRAGEFPNMVLFSFEDAPPGAVFSDYHAWHIVLNAIDWAARVGHELGLRPLGVSVERQVLKPSWSRADWLRKARRAPASVQAVVPELDLATATAIWGRNQPTRRRLIDLGFSAERVAVRRLRVED